MNGSNEVSTREIKGTLFKTKFSRICFLIPKAKVVFIYLKKIFTKVLILHYLDLKRHIQIKIDVSSFAIDEILSKLTLRYVTYTNLYLFTSEIC